MKSKSIYYVICLLLLAAAFGNSACSSARISAQSSRETSAGSEKPVGSPTLDYKKPRRVSKDVIIADEKETKPAKVKAKTK